MRPTGADGGVIIRHQLPHRLRIDLPDPLTAERLELISSHFALIQPDVIVRSTSHGSGLVVSGSIDERVCPALVISLVQASMQAPAMHGPSTPPTAWQIWLGSTRQGSIKVLMALAVAGWALPVLPGTPFFLLAWWLGWRPPERSGEPQLEPAALQASA